MTRNRVARTCDIGRNWVASWSKTIAESKKPVFLLVALAAFVFILSVGIAPNQGALNSSTSLDESQLNNVDPKFEEQIPIQEVDLSSSGRSIFIAFVMLAHVLFANLHLGGAWVAVGSESVFLLNRRKPDAERFNRLAKSLTLFNVMLFSAGATFAIAGVLFFISLYPTFASYAFHIYWWPLLIEAFTFAFEIFFLYTYWFSWDKISRRWHQLLGYSYAVDVFIQVLMINTIASGMLTPGASTITFSGPSGLFLIPFSEYVSWWFNATLWPLQFHRLFAAISFFGFLIAMLAMIHYRDQEKNPTSMKYWDWVGSYGLGIGIFGLIVQIPIGLIYMFTIFYHQPLAFNMIMTGPRAWEMLLMIGLLSLLLLACISYFIDRREKILILERFKRVKYLFVAVFVIAAVAGFIIVQPAWLGTTYRYAPGAWINPIGAMIYKFVALFVLILVAGIVVSIDTLMLRREKEAEWGNLSVASRGSLMIGGVLGMWIVIVMGFVRESSRSPWTIFDIIPVPGGQSYPTPIPINQIFVVWAVILALTLAIFWFASRVTAYHPEKADVI